MPAFDMTINMVSLFALIIVLGMVVDDAIIIGEAGYAKILSGKGRLEGAIEGAREMATPVSFAILTTIAAFSPLLVIPGLFGKIFRIIPLMVIGVLIFSLLESFFILPAHLANMGDDPRWLKPVVALQNRVSEGLQRFIKQVYRPIAHLAVEWRYSTVAGSLALLFLTVGLVVSGIVPRSFFPALEGDLLSATIQFPYGSNVEAAEKAGRALQESAEETMEKFGGEDYVRGMFLRVGSAPPQRGPGPAGVNTGSHIVSLEINLVPGEEREFTSAQFKDAWQAANEDFVGARSVVFTSAIGPSAGAAVALQLSHRSSEVLNAASEETAKRLSTYSDLTNVENGFVGGKHQLNFTLKEESARALGVTSELVARQIRAAFFGAEALREQRGRNELRVMVRLPKNQRASEYDIESLEIRTPSGAYVALGEVADFSRNRAPTTIDREDGRRVVTVSGALAPGVKSPTNVLEDVTGALIPRLQEAYPELTVGLVGEQREQGEVFSSLGPNALLALFLIFSLLAVPLKSYIQPLIIMSAIPFGFVGAVWGHLLMGYQLSFVSALGIIALAGVVVNDSLVLVDTTNRYRRAGASAYDAITQGGARRFRPILLTSLTTFFGLLPMIFEQSVQAKFLIPMAVSLGFGVLFATVIILLLVPALYMITEDVRVLFGAKDERAPSPGGWEPAEA
jgi:multidrug efflux pump subunit AcrB